LHSHKAAVAAARAGVQAAHQVEVRRVRPLVHQGFQRGFLNHREEHPGHKHHDRQHHRFDGQSGQFEQLYGHGRFDGIFLE